MSSAGQQGSSAGRQGQRPVQSSAPRPQSVARPQAQRVAARPGYEATEVIEIREEHVIKKTIWKRVLTGATQTAATTRHHVTHPGHAFKAAKRLIPRSNPRGKEPHGQNLSFYRKAYFHLDKQTQFDLYVAGMAPKMTEREVYKLRSTVQRVRKQYKPVPVMYAAQVSPSGYRAPPIDILAQAEAARAHAAAAAKKKKQAGAATNPDALPAHPTPSNYTKTHVVQTRPTTTGTTAAAQQRPPPSRLSQAQGRGLRPPGTTITTTTTTTTSRPISQARLTIPANTSQQNLRSVSPSRQTAVGKRPAQTQVQRQSMLQPQKPLGMFAQIEQDRQVRRSVVGGSGIGMGQEGQGQGQTQGQRGRRVRGQSVVNPVPVYGRG